MPHLLIMVNSFLIFWLPSSRILPLDVVFWVSESRSVMSDSLRRHGPYVHGIPQARILEWVTFLFSRGSSQPRDQTQISCIVGRFFTSLSHQGSPRILEWVAYPFSSGSSQPRNWTRVSCIAGRHLTSWATREAQRGRDYTKASIPRGKDLW